MRMKWLCCRGKNNNAVWIAIMAVLISTNSATAHVHHGRTWLVGVAIGAVAMLIVGGLAILARRKFRCE